jgi:phospholipid/cholesterol/gamma-HCH transport system ATP-binding protein
MSSVVPPPVVSVEEVVTRFGEQTVHNGVSFTLPRGVIAAVIGGSGTGKSVLLKELLGLLQPTEGTLKLFGVDVWKAPERELETVRRRYGVLFQNGALFSALSVAENVATPLREQRAIPEALMEDVVTLRLALSGLSHEVGLKMPSELSGGMRKRAALARALALEPELLFLDEPTSGLDPINARGFDRVIRTLCDSMGLTVLMVTHDIDTLASVVDVVIALGEGKVLAQGSFKEVSAVQHPWIQSYFSARASV